MNERTKKEIMGFADQKKIEGFVYVGYGQEPCLREVLGVKIFNPRRMSGKYEKGDTSANLSGNYDGGVFLFDYYITQEDWNKLFGEPSKDKNALELPEGWTAPKIEVPKGFKMVARGFGWTNNGKNATYFTGEKKRGSNTSWDKTFSSGLGEPCGYKDLFYIELVKDEEIKNNLSIKEQIDFAKSLIGKKVYFKDGSGYALIGGYSLEDDSYTCDQEDVQESVLGVVKKQGVAVVLDGEGEEYDLVRPIQPDDVIENYKFHTAPKVNGYDAVERGEFYSFGCAIISKKVLRSAKQLLELGKDGGSVQPAEIKIGKGIFTLEILKELNL